MAITAADAKTTAAILVQRRDTLDRRIAEYHDAPASHRENPQAQQTAREWVIQRDLIADVLAAMHGYPGSLKIF